MRDAFTSLTARGRALLAGGVTTLVCAVLLAEPLLFGFGILAVALPLLAVIVLSSSRTDLTLSRHLTPGTVPIGSPATVHLRITNTGRAPLGALMLEDTVPFALGARPRFVLSGVAKGWQREVTYRVHSDIRGRYELGPMTVRSVDPFGLVEIPRSFRVITPLVVTPRTLRLNGVPGQGARDALGERRARASSAGDAEDATVREYRQGDDLRRVHWRSSARSGELMVRREEQHSRARATIFLDTRAVAHTGHGAASSLEPAITIASSAAAHLLQAGWSVQLWTPGGRLAEATRPSDLPLLLAALAGTQVSTETSLDLRTFNDVSPRSQALAMLGALGPNDVAGLTRLASITSGTSRSPALALQVDVRSWGAVDPQMTPGLTPTGWRTVRLDRSTDLAAAWQSLWRGSPTAASRPWAPPSWRGGSSAGSGGTR